MFSRDIYEDNYRVSDKSWGPLRVELLARGRLWTVSFKLVLVSLFLITCVVMEIRVGLTYYLCVNYVIVAIYKENERGQQTLTS